MEEKTSSGTTSMAENASSNASPAKKALKTKSKNQQRSSHPPTSEMVNAAIKELKDRKGSSLQAIKKYIATTYKIDGEKVAPFVKRYLKTAVTSGAVVQTKGKGASGSFKLSTTTKGSEVKSKPKRIVKRPQPAVEKKPVEKKASQKKTVAPKKPAPTKKTSPVIKKAAAIKEVKTAPAKKAELPKQKAMQPKNLSKTKKATKAPAAKTRAPKPKTAQSSKAAKATAKK
ncbi:histone H1-like [Ceratina calcarata]|uniref:Histone H1-like n=1 Tax=Ceratina calcarata TaxID=156304 RepID=A0AAJ7ISA2_9HYME|nr:histone H1-like [Ceratina calcarata]